MPRQVAVVLGLVVAMGAGFVLYFGLRPQSATLPAPAPGTAPAPAATTEPPPLPASEKVVGSGAHLATERAHYPTQAELAERARQEVKFRDYVCGKETPESKCVFAQFEGARYAFCSEDCKAKFLAAPHKYLSR